jgi:hypothetical protein
MTAAGEEGRLSGVLAGGYRGEAQLVERCVALNIFRLAICLIFLTSCDGDIGVAP